MDTQNEKQYSSKLERHVIYLKEIDYTTWKKRGKCVSVFSWVSKFLFCFRTIENTSSVTQYELCCITYHFVTESRSNG